jgi:hypothetical protein
MFRTEECCLRRTGPRHPVAGGRNPETVHLVVGRLTRRSITADSPEVPFEEVCAAIALAGLIASNAVAFTDRRSNHPT